MFAGFLILAGAYALGAEEGRRLALLISVQETRDPRLRRLWFCDDDVRELGTQLTKVGFSSENIAVLTQRVGFEMNAVNLQPSAANIRANLKRLCGEARAEDVVLISFSGHGVQLKRDGRIYLCPPEALLYDTNSLVPLDEIVKELGSKCKAKVKLLLIDACRNDPTDGRPEAIARPPYPDPPAGIALFLGCAKGQGSFETGHIAHGVFFHHVILGLQGAARDIDGEITLASLEDYIAREVPISIARYRRKPTIVQTPEFHNSVREKFVFGKAPDAGPTPASIRGAGTSADAPIQSLWADAYNASNPATKVEFRSGGLIGLKALKARTAHFATSDSPLASGEQDILQIPTVAIPFVPIYNLPGIANLTLDGPVLAEISLGTVENWSDPKIAALNPGVALPNQHIVVVYRDDDSNTARIFANYLATVSNEWKERLSRGGKVHWPVGAAGNGTDEVVRIVFAVEGAMGIVERSAEKEKLLANLAAVRMKSQQTGIDNPYPIGGTKYVLIPKDLTYLKDRKLAEELVKYLRWCATKGMDLARPTHGVLSAENQASAERMLNTVTFEGKRVTEK